MLLSKDVTIQHRPKDAELVKKATTAALKQYKEIAGLESDVKFEGELADDSAGGVIGSTMAGRIRVDNTLAERLRILEEKVRWSLLLLACPKPLTRTQMLPELREDLFGKNPHRKFYT